MEIIVTEDGSHTLYVPKLQETYHSKHGAIQESQHVFIDAGFTASSSSPLQIFEVGFGTGLNALLTAVEAEKQQRKTVYHTIEAFPIAPEIIEQLNYCSAGSELQEYHSLFIALHQANWNTTVAITPWFELHKIQGDATNYRTLSAIDLVYFDAFAPEKQPSMWEQSVFENIHAMMNEKAIFVTYCAKGALKRMLKTVGFGVESLPGPPGKREMTRAFKAS